MFRIYEVRRGERHLLGGTTSLATAQRFVLRVAGNPLIHGAAMGSYRGPNEFLPRTVTGDVAYEIVPAPAVSTADWSAAA